MDLNLVAEKLPFVHCTVEVILLGIGMSSVAHPRPLATG